MQRPVSNDCATVLLPDQLGSSRRPRQSGPRAAASKASASRAAGSVSSQDSIAGCCVPWPGNNNARLMALRTRAAANRRQRARRRIRRARGCGRQSRDVPTARRRDRPCGGAARHEEVARRALRIAQPCQPAAMRQVGVFESGDGVEECLHTGALRVHAQAYRTPQRGKRRLEQDRKTQRGFRADAAQPETAGSARPVRRRGAQAACSKRITPSVEQRSANRQGPRTARRARQQHWPPRTTNRC